MTADIRTFWGALVSVLLKCIAALGFTTPERAAARSQAAVADRTQTAVGTAVTTAAGTAPAPAGPPAPPSTRRADILIPAPRACEFLPQRRERERTLPPTMKQRIRAEAHGSSPSARSLPAGAELTDLAGLAGLANSAKGVSSADSVGERALCG
jgi:hypothetical protein